MRTDYFSKYFKRTLEQAFFGKNVWTNQMAILNFPIPSRKYSRWAICLKSPSILIVPAVSVLAMKKFKMISLAWHFSYPGKALIKGSFFEKFSKKCFQVRTLGHRTRIASRYSHRLYLSWSCIFQNWANCWKTTDLHQLQNLVQLHHQLYRNQCFQ